MRHNTFTQCKTWWYNDKTSNNKVRSNKQYESARADIETTYTISDEDALDLDKAMEVHEYELRRARIHLKDALRTVKDELAGVVPKEAGKALKASEAKKLKELLKQYGGD